MEERQSPSAGGPRDVGRVLHGGMPPALLLAVLLLRVLGVVDDQVGAAHERDVPLIAGVIVPAGRRGPERLVIGGVGDAGASARDAVGDGRRRVVQVLGLDQHATDAEEALVELGEVDARAQIAQLHREVRVLHLPGHRLFQAALEAEGGVDVQLGPGHEGGDEEGKALDVIPVRVTDEEVEAGRLGHLGEMQAEAAGAGATVEHDQRAVGSTDFHTRRITTVTRRLFPGRGNRPSGAPEPYVHVTLAQVGMRA